MRKWVLIFILVLFSSPANALWDDCPFGLVNDTYPGECGRYIDTDKDRICDHSQPAPEDRVIQEDVQKAQEEGTTTKEGSTADLLVSRYNVIPISLMMIFLILLSEYAVKKSILELMTVKYLWNVILALSFFICLGASLPSIFPALKLIPAHLFWHVETGIIMSWIVIYHLWGRRHFYTRCIPKKKQKCP